MPYKKVAGMAGVKVECLAGGNRDKRLAKMGKWVKQGATRKREVLIIGELRVGSRPLHHAAMKSWLQDTTPTSR